MARWPDLLCVSESLWWVFHLQIEIQNLFPHRSCEKQMPLLACVLLGDLQFNGFTGVAQAGEQRLNRLAYLEVDGAILDLNNHVVVKLAVERMEIIVGGLG